MRKMQEDFYAAPTCQNGNRGAARERAKGRGSEKFSTAAQKIKITKKLSFAQFPQSFPPFFAKKRLKNALKKKKWENHFFPNAEKRGRGNRGDF